MNNIIDGKLDVPFSLASIPRSYPQPNTLVLCIVLLHTLDNIMNESISEVSSRAEHGNVAEDLRSQILGQLSERISYDKLYQQALSDPELKRTRVEVEAALANAS